MNIASGEQEDVYFLWGWNQTVQGCFFSFFATSKAITFEDWKVSGHLVQPLTWCMSGLFSRPDKYDQSAWLKHPWWQETHYFTASGLFLLLSFPTPLSHCSLYGSIFYTWQNRGMEVWRWQEQGEPQPDAVLQPLGGCAVADFWTK